jgi:hypothetical protein
LNSVVLLALDKGFIDKSDVYSDPMKLKSKLERDGILYSAIELGNLMFSLGLKELNKAKDYSSRIDIDALIFSVYILRVFSLRKWLMKQHDWWKFLDSRISNVSDEIIVYTKYISSSLNNLN